MKKSTILNGFLIGAVLAGLVYAAPRAAFEVTKTYLNEGNSRTPIAVACSSTTWTQVLPAGITRRAAAMHTLSTAGATVCLSTTSTSGTTCVAATSGVHLEAGGSFIDNSEDAMNCRLADATAGSVYIYGFTYIDTKDNGDITN